MTATGSSAAAWVEQGLAETAALLPPDDRTVRPYQRLALRDPAALTAFLATLGAGISARLWWLAAAALAAWVLWLLLAPRVPAIRRARFDARLDAERAAAEKARRAGALADLDARDVGRVEDLLERRQRFARRASAAPGSEGDALLADLGKADALVGVFVRLARDAARYEGYLNDLDEPQLERDRRRYEGAGEDDGARRAAEIARQGLVRAQRVRRYVDALRDQMDAIQTAFRAVVTPMPGQRESPAAPSLDAILDGVAALVETAHESDQVGPGFLARALQRTPAP